MKKGFTFLTGPTQTSFTLKFFNNAPGGGGNDWALDDISVSTCSPDMKYGPQANPTICDSNTLLITDTVRSFFNNYGYYKWQRSTNGGASWNDITGPLGPATPFWNGSAWEYVASYTIPPTQTAVSNSGDMYRLVVATTLANLSNANCRFTDAGNIITLNIIDCGIPMATALLSFDGSLVNERTLLHWVTGTEDEVLWFEVQRSNDGINFNTIGVENGFNNGNPLNNYSFIDPVAVAGKAYYRIRMVGAQGKEKYSRTIMVSSEGSILSFISVINPFQNELTSLVFSPETSNAEVELIDRSGAIIRHTVFGLRKGVNEILIPQTGNLASGIYILQVKSGGSIIRRKILKHPR